MSLPTTVPGVAAIAADLLRPGILKHELHRETPEGHRYCAVGAVRAAITGKANPWQHGIPVELTPTQLALHRATIDRIVQEIGSSDFGVVPWNNAEERTTDQVVAVFERVAAA